MASWTCTSFSKTKQIFCTHDVMWHAFQQHIRRKQIVNCQITQITRRYLFHPLSVKFRCVKKYEEECLFVLLISNFWSKCQEVELTICQSAADSLIKKLWNCLINIVKRCQVEIVIDICVFQQSFTMCFVIVSLRIISNKSCTHTKTKVKVSKEKVFLFLKFKKRKGLFRKMICTVIYTHSQKVTWCGLSASAFFKLQIVQCDNLYKSLSFFFYFFCKVYLICFGK